MFVKEVKKPNGEAYAADSIFYLVLGVQVLFLFESTGGFLPLLTSYVVAGRTLAAHCRQKYQVAGIRTYSVDHLQPVTVSGCF